VGCLFVLPLPSLGKENIIKSTFGILNYLQPWRLFNFSWQAMHSRWLPEWPFSIFSFAFLGCEVWTQVCWMSLWDSYSSGVLNERDLHIIWMGMGFLMFFLFQFLLNHSFYKPIILMFPRGMIWDTCPVKGYRLIFIRGIFFHYTIQAWSG
jgi:hypothetical protein